jgi:hypothetical protein
LFSLNSLNCQEELGEALRKVLQVSPQCLKNKHSNAPLWASKIGPSKSQVCYSPPFGSLIQVQVVPKSNRHNCPLFLRSLGISDSNDMSKTDSTSSYLPILSIEAPFSKGPKTKFHGFLLLIPLPVRFPLL